MDYKEAAKPLLTDSANASLINGFALFGSTSLSGTTLFGQPITNLPVTTTTPELDGPTAPEIMDQGTPIATPTGTSFAQTAIDSVGVPLPSAGGSLSDATTGADVASQYEATMNARYDQLLAMPYDQFKQSYYVGQTDSAKGSIFLSNGTGYLDLNQIQRIENSRGTAGALLMHLQEPAIAKNTAGYSSGSDSTFTNTPPSNPVIETVAQLPDVTKGADGTVSLPPGTQIPVETQQSMFSISGKWWIWYVIAAIIIIVYIKLHKR